MKRKIGVGDIVIASGIVLMFVFLLVSVFTVPKYQTAWPVINCVILILLTLGAGGILALSLMGNPKFLNILYVYAAFIVILHCSLFRVTSYIPGRPGMEFHVFVGALLIGIGTYMVQQGGEALTGEKKK